MKLFETEIVKQSDDVHHSLFWCLKLLLPQKVLLFLQMPNQINEMHALAYKHTGKTDAELSFHVIVLNTQLEDISNSMRMDIVSVCAVSVWYRHE